MKSVYISHPFFRFDSLLIEKISSTARRLGYRVYTPIDILSENDSNESLNLISKSHFVFGIVDEEAMNVFFDLGYAIAKEKKVLLISTRHVRLPSSLSGVEIINGYDEDITKYLRRFLEYYHSPDEDLEAQKDALLTWLAEPVDDSSFLSGLDPKLFEETIYNLFEQKGFEPAFDRKLYGAGYDFFLGRYKNYTKTLVELKKYNSNNKVSLGEIHKLLGAMYANNADCGIYLTTSQFTNSAKDFAEKVSIPIELWDIERFMRALSE